MLERLGHWISDYAYLFRGALYPIWRHPPEHYLGYVLTHKNPVVLLPGVGSTWHFLRKLGDHLSHQGHPVYVIPELRFTIDEVPKLARITGEFIERKSLRNVVLVGHSKGGLIGKYLLAFFNGDHRIKKLVAVATPFGGSHIVRWLPARYFRELHPAHNVIEVLRAKDEVNKNIVSIFGIWDNHIWPTEYARLGGAKNIQVPIHGHHKIVFNKEVLEIVSREVDL